MKAHLTCLADLFLADDRNELLPIGGACVSCRKYLLWGDLILDMKSRDDFSSRSREKKPLKKSVSMDSSTSHRASDARDVQEDVAREFDEEELLSSDESAEHSGCSSEGEEIVFDLTQQESRRNADHPAELISTDEGSDGDELSITLEERIRRRAMTT